MKYSVLAAYLGVVSGDTYCLDEDFGLVEGCECHDSCGTACGYYDWPDANDDCIDCPAGSTLHAIYSDGTGYCVEDSQTSNDGCLDGNYRSIEGCECHESCGGSCGYYSWPVDADDCINCPVGSTLNAIYSDGTGTCEQYMAMAAPPPDDHEDDGEEDHMLIARAPQGSSPDDQEQILLKDLEKSLTHLINGQLTSIFGQTYVQSSQIGLASYHFVQKSQGIDESSYINYAGAPSYWTRRDGSKPPAKKYFDNPEYNAASKTFKGDIYWGDNTFGGAAKWQYEMKFSNDLMKIDSGYVKSFDTSYTLTRTDYFGQALRYEIV